MDFNATDRHIGFDSERERSPGCKPSRRPQDCTAGNSELDRTLHRVSTIDDDNDVTMLTFTLDSPVKRAPFLQWIFKVNTKSPNHHHSQGDIVPYSCRCCRRANIRDCKWCTCSGNCSTGTGRPNMALRRQRRCYSLDLLVDDHIYCFVRIYFLKTHRQRNSS